MWKTLWAKLKRILRIRDKNPFSLSERIAASVSPTELEIYKLDAYRNGKSLSDWIRATLNAGVSRGTLNHLSKGSIGYQSSIDSVYRMLDEKDRNFEGSPILPLTQERRMPPKKISGHPCRHLDPTIPRNFDSSNCSGICTSRKPGMGGRPCFWSALAANQCPAFDPKTELPFRPPTKPSK